MKTRFAIIAALILTAPPVWGQSWDSAIAVAKSRFLREWRASLMSTCDEGRQSNSRGVSYWDPIAAKLRDDRYRSVDVSSRDIMIFNQAEAAAMAEVCPEVK